jgi:small neutral amino acid transporter SnatA (MarC family)
VREARRRLAWAGAGLLVGAVAVFGVVAPPERCPAVTEAGLRAAADEAVQWFVRNQEADGQWLYQYDAAGARVVPDYNVIRHAGVMMSLYQAAAAGLPDAQAAADRGLVWITGRLVERDGWVAVRSGPTLPVGGSALLAAGLVERRLVTGDERHDELLRGLGRFLAAQTEPSGAVRASYELRSATAPPGVYSRYYTGEAYWALARLHLAFPDERWGELADRVGGYVAGRRDEAEGYWPPLPDHWAAYGQSETVTFPERATGALTEDEATYARRQAGLFGSQVRWISQRAGGWGAVVRGPFVPRGGGYGVIGEALTGLWLVAGAEPALAEVRPQIARRAACIAGLAMAAQQDPDEADAYEEPERVRGAWLRDGETRMDDQQHALSALLRTMPIVALQDGDGSDPNDGDGASAWLWAVVVVAALNPPRAAFGVPRLGRSPREVAGLAGLGGVVGAGGIVVVAALGRPLADLLDVSEPALRIGAGAVAALIGAVDLVRRLPPPEPSLPGWRAALVPVAVPLVARPGLVILAAAAGAAAMVPATAVAMAAGVLVLAIAAAWLPEDGPRRRVVRWGARVMAAGLVVVSAALVVGGILAV